MWFHSTGYARSLYRPPFKKISQIFMLGVHLVNTINEIHSLFNSSLQNVKCVVKCNGVFLNQMGIQLQMHHNSSVLYVGIDNYFNI